MCRASTSAPVRPGCSSSSPRPARTSCRSTGASTSMRGGSASGSNAACRATSTLLCCLGRPAWSARARSTSCAAPTDGWDTSSTSGMASLPTRASRTFSCSSRPCIHGCRRVSPETGVLCMAYGSPATEADIAAYFTHIRGGRPPSPEALEELTARYRAIGGVSPLTEITRAQAAALSARSGLPAFVGMKHAAPFIADGAAEAKRAGIGRLVGLPLAPHYARMSLGGYERSLREAWDGELVFIRGFHDHPAFI